MRTPVFFCAQQRAASSWEGTRGEQGRSVEPSPVLTKGWQSGERINRLARTPSAHFRWRRVTPAHPRPRRLSVASVATNCRSAFPFAALGPYSPSLQREMKSGAAPVFPFPRKCASRAGRVERLFPRMGGAPRPAVCCQRSRAAVGLTRRPRRSLVEINRTLSRYRRYVVPYYC